MKLSAILGTFFMSTWIAAAAEFTNRFAIFLVNGEVPRASIIEGTATPSGLSLSTEPIISDKDLMGYDTTNHTFLVVPAVATKVTETCRHHLQTPFVLVAGGERIYLGVFTSMISSISSGVPAITGFWGATNNLTSVRLRIDRGYPSDGFGVGVDRRGDPRVLAEISKLFPSPKGIR